MIEAFHKTQSGSVSDGKCSFLCHFMSHLRIPQVWPVSCSLGAMIGFLTGLVAAPVWIHYHRKQLTYKSK